jgi:hypothetical protein
VASVTPFVQVGTSCTSTVSRGTDYTFTWSQRLEAVTAESSRLTARTIRDQGRRVMRLAAHPESLTSLSRYGDHHRTGGLTLGIARGAPACSTGRVPPI